MNVQKLFFGQLFVFVVACNSSKKEPIPNVHFQNPIELVSESRRLLDDPASSRDTLIRKSEQLESAARGEGSTSRTGTFATLAAILRSRTFRMQNQADVEEIKHAIELLHFAIKQMEFPELCQAILERIRLIHEGMHDSKEAYRELQLAQARFAQTTCAEPLKNIQNQTEHWPLTRVEREEIKRSLHVYDTLSESARWVRVSQWSTHDFARIVLEFDRSIAYSIEEASSETLQIRLDGIDLKSTQKIEPIKGIVRSTQIHENSKSNYLTLHFSQPVHRRVFFLPNPFRLIIDLSTHPIQVDSFSGSRALRRVVIDAGHGGVDPGAIGPQGLNEKDVTFAIAKDVAPLIAHELGASVRLTRANDSFVSLEERTQIANSFHADVMLSIHCNAAEFSARRGIEMYVLDHARNDNTRALAFRENNGNEASSKELQRIFDSLPSTQWMDTSRHLAHLFQRAMMASLHTGQPSFFDVPDGGVHSAGFFLLTGSHMPAVLFEVGFISNPVEEEYLRTYSFRKRIVDAIVNGLKAYKEGI